VIPVKEAFERLDRHQIDNAAMLIAVGWLARHRAGLRRRWLRPAPARTRAKT
jgi:hypothetical protein